MIIEYQYFSKHCTAKRNNDMSNPQNLQPMLSWIMHWLGEGDRDLPKDAEASKQQTMHSSQTHN